MKKLLLYFLLLPIVTIAQTFDFSASVSEGCSPLLVTFTNETDAAHKDNYRYEWFVEPGKFSVETNTIENTYLSPGNYDCVMKVYDLDNNLIETVSKSNFVTVFKDPDVKIKTDKISDCVYKGFQFSVDTETSDSPIDSYTWVFSDGGSYDTKLPPPHFFTEPGEQTVFVAVRDEKGCVNRIRHEIKVTTFNDFPNTFFDVDTRTVCDNTLTSVFTNNTEEASPTTYTWNFGDSSPIVTTKNATHTFNGYGDYVVTLTATVASGCSAEGKALIRLIDYKPNFVIHDGIKGVSPNSDLACLGTITFTNATLPDNATITFKWDYEDNGSIDGNKNSFSVTETTPGDKFLRLTVHNGACEKTIVKKYTVEKKLEVTYSPTNEFYCEPTNVTYTPISNIPGSTYTWYINNTVLLGESVSYMYDTEGVFSDSVRVVSPNQCPQSYSKSNNVEVLFPKISIEPVSTELSGCAPLTVSYKTTVDYPTTRDGVNKFEWDLDDNGVFEKTGPSPQSITFTKRGEYSAKLRTTTNKGCVILDTVNDKAPLYLHLIKVGQKPSGKFTFPDTSICAYDVLKFQFHSSQDSLMNSIFDTIVVSFPPDVPNQYSSPNLNELATSQPKELRIKLRDSIGVHKVYAVLSDHGCKNQFSVNDSTANPVKPFEIMVNGPIIEVEGSNKDCSDNYNYSYKLTKRINVDTTKPTEYFDWYLKKKSGGSTFEYTKIASNIDSIKIDYDIPAYGRGVYEVLVVANNKTEMCGADLCNCVDSVLAYTIITDIKADFTLSDYTPCVGDSVAITFGANMQDVDSIFWAGTNKPIKMGETNKFFVDKRGHQTHGFWVKDIFECIDDTTVTYKGYKPKADLVADIISDCLPFESKFSDLTQTDTPIVSRHWYLGTDLISQLNDSIITETFLQKGYITPQIIVTDLLGCKDTIQKKDYIRPVVPNSEFVVAHPKLCAGHDALLIRDTKNPELDNNIHKFMWDFGDGTTESVDLKDTTAHTYTIGATNPTTYSISLVAYSMSPEGNECMSQTNGSIEVKEVTPEIKTIPRDICKEPGQKFLIDIDYAWYAGRYKTQKWQKIDGTTTTTVSSSSTPKIYSFSNYGNQYIRLITTSDYYGCLHDTATMLVNVPGYEVDFDLDKELICAGEEITVTRKNAINVDSYKSYWSFGDGVHNYTDLVEAKHAYQTLPQENDNIFKIQYIVEAENCKPRDIFKLVELYPVAAYFDRGQNDLDTAGCAPFTVQFYNFSVGSKGNDYTWNFGDGSPTSTEKNPIHTFANPDDIYNVELFLKSSICEHAFAKPIQTYPNATSAITVDSALCVGETTSIKAEGNFTSLSWRPIPYFANSTQKETTISPLLSGYVYADLFTNHGCKSSDSAYVYVQKYPKYQGAPDSLLLYYKNNELVKKTNPDASIIAGQMYNVNNTPIEGIEYIWTPSLYLSCTDCPSPDINLQCGTVGYPSCIDFPKEIEYSILMIDTMGCFTNTANIQFTIVIESKAALPKAFTPNADGDNDIAFVRSWGVKEFLEVKIFNRWGQVIFESNDLRIGWDGTYKGAAQPMDTYAYTIRYIDTKDEEIFLKGYITLIR